MSWSHTLQLPKSRLANRSNPKLIAQNLGRVTTDLYRWQERQVDRPQLVLHDGPPYANGELHMGHALNKTLKDFVTRFGVLSGHRVDYRPGWDCHGLPIEHAASKHYKAKKNTEELTAVQRRRLARQWALKMMGHQLKSFQGFALMADWEDPQKRYLTLDPGFVARELRVFAQLVEKDLIFRQRKPVFWSVDSGTALAESELVYGERESTTAYLAYPLSSGPVKAKLAVWTTTPWTLPANQLIAVNPEMEYVVVKSGGDSVVCAADLLEALTADGVLHSPVVESRLLGADLVGSTYTCPLRGSVHNVVGADHVVSTAGTGLVHTAPGHGNEDYQVGQKLGVAALSPVDACGKYTSEVGLPDLVGLDARTEGQQLIMKILRNNGALMHTNKIVHSVPLDWRTKTPVMVRATPQFFMDLGEKVQKLALQAIDTVEFKPESARHRLQAFTSSRSDWCISRQRPWGVPIPVLFDANDEPLLSREVVDHIINQMEALGDRGLDRWFSEEADVEFWLPPSMRGSGQTYRKCGDTLDVWLDSGSSWTMLDKTPSDFVLEGSDQHRGWFQSSLLLHVAMKDAPVAPYKRLITHGFVLDENRQKMSKSLGNTVAPQQIVADIGIDGLRLLIAQGDYTSDISLNSTATQQVAAMVKKFRLTFKFLLGNLNGYEHSDSAAAFSDLDRYTLDHLNTLVQETKQAYADQNFQVVVKLVQAHMNTELSAIYFDAVKDVLYADPVDSPARRAVQQVLWHILDTYVRMLAPILPLLTQEVWDLCPASITRSLSSPLMDGYPVPVPAVSAPQSVTRALELRPTVNDAIEQARSAGHIGSSLASDIYIEGAAASALDPQLLEQLYIVSQVKINEPLPAVDWSFQAGSGDIMVTCVPAALHKCGRCWKYTAPKEDTICGRCEHAT